MKENDRFMEGKNIYFNKQTKKKRKMQREKVGWKVYFIIQSLGLVESQLEAFIVSFIALSWFKVLSAFL